MDDLKVDLDKVQGESADYCQEMIGLIDKVNEKEEKKKN